jgi:hypothetical protein
LARYAWDQYYGYVYQCRIVFTAASVDWARVLVKSKDPVVEKITLNIIDILGFPGGKAMLTKWAYILDSLHQKERKKERNHNLE